MIMEKTASLKLVAFLAVLFCFVNATKSTGVPKVKAVAYVISKWGPKGILHFKQEGDGPTTIRGKLYHLSPGAHGFHIHAYGDVAHFCQSTGDHFNPFHKDHGGPEDWVRHAGDLGNIYVGSDGEVVINIVDKHRLIPLVGPNSIIGRSVVVHDKNDDLGKVVGNRNSRKNGNAGDKIACGAIGLQA